MGKNYKPEQDDDTFDSRTLIDKRMDNCSMLEWYIFEHEREKKHPLRQISQIITPSKRKLYKDYSWRSMRNLLVSVLKSLDVDDYKISKIFGVCTKTVHRVKDVNTQKLK
jgi:hypothetical protein